MPKDVQVELGDFISRLAEVYNFKNGETALYWHLTEVLKEHISEGKE